MARAQVIDGKQIARDLRADVATRAAAHAATTGTTPGLATVLVGNDASSEVYVASKRKAATAAGIADIHHHLPGDASQAQVGELVDALAADTTVSGILVQLPLPAALDADDLLDRIPYVKDVDGLTTTSTGLLARGLPGLRPCTPSGVLTMLAAIGVELEGARAVVVGRSRLVGLPMAMLLGQSDATATAAHSKTRDLEQVTREADVLVVAAGRPGLVGADHLKPGAVVIDVGIHRTPDGLVGDVRHDEVADVASWLTPVPGGVGPMTIATLLDNTVRAALLQVEIGR